MTRPLIGVTTYGRNDENRYHLPAEYVEAVRRAGAIPLLIPPGDTDLADLLPTLNGVIFSGGGDIDPARYRGAHHETIMALDAERDEAELALAARLLDADLPVLAICRGMQLINVALGGALHPHLPEAVGESVFHRAPPHLPIQHTVSVSPESKLGAALGRPVANPISWHHQGVDRLGDGLVLTATAPDGVIEAAELPTHPWLVAVQWHPELSAAYQPEQQALFDALAQTARERAATEQ